MSSQHAVTRAMDPRALLHLHWGIHCNHKIFFECVRLAGRTPRINNSDPLKVDMTCYHCGERFTLLEAELQAGDLTEDEVRRDITGARFI